MGNERKGGVSSLSFFKEGKRGSWERKGGGRGQHQVVRLFFSAREEEKPSHRAEEGCLSFAQRGGGKREEKAAVLSSFY